MRWKWDENEMMSIYPGVSRIGTPRRSVHLRYPCISVHPPSLINDVLGGRDRASWEMHLEAVIERVWRGTLRPWSSEFGDAIGGRDRANLEAVIERVWRCTLRPWLWTQRCTGRPWLSEFGDALAGYDQARLEEYLEAVDTWCMLYSVLSHDHGMER